MSSVDLDAFRQDIRSWIDDNLPQELRVGTRKDLPRELLSQWNKALISRGLVAPEWSTEYGGGGLDRKQAAIVKEELNAVREELTTQNEQLTRELNEARDELAKAARPSNR